MATRMTRIGFFMILSFSILTISSCQDKELAAELDEWCECNRKNTEGTAAAECMDLMIKMSEKYEYDPGAVKIIQERAAECR